MQIVRLWSDATRSEISKRDKLELI